MESPIVITASHFYQYDAQPLWLWYDQFGDPALKEEQSDFAKKMVEEGVLHEEKIIETLDVVEVKTQNPEQAFEETKTLMKEGCPLIYQGAIEAQIGGVLQRGRPDLMEKREDSFGNSYYVPLDIKASHAIKTIHILQLMFYAEILESLQSRRPEEGAILNSQGTRLAVDLNDVENLKKLYSKKEAIIAILKGDKPEITITSKAKGSPWYKTALCEAEAKRDIALVYKLDSRSAVSLRDQGIRTLDDLVKADIANLPKIPYASSESLKRAQLQAQALKEKKTIWLERQSLPDSSLKLFFDIEGDPSLDVDYLFGFWVVGDDQKTLATRGNAVSQTQDDGKYFLYFLAESPEDEKAMWQDFLQWLDCLPHSYAVFHYADYEKTHLKKLAKKYESTLALEVFIDKLSDLRKAVEKSVICPLYFYSIKDIAKSDFVNFQWRHEKAGGGQSVFWYEQWLETQDRAILQDIINYNEDDVRATECVYEWLTLSEIKPEKPS